MSLERNIGRAVLDLGDLVKGNVVRELSKAQLDGAAKLTEKDVRVLAKIIEASIDSTFRNGIDGVLRLVKG